MRVEYLIIIEADTPFCSDRTSFNNFLQSNADIKISKNSLRHRSFESIDELKGGEAEGQKNRFFHIKLECKSDDQIEEFQESLKAVRSLLHKVSEKKPQVLWDDVSFYYAQKAYPLIHQIENMMRKLITKFMLTNVGLGWTREAMPEDLRKGSRGEGSESNNNYLYETDFKDLSTFLFDEYRTDDIKALNQKIRSLEADAILVSELKPFIPRSNWERYFREHVNCEATYLQGRWEKLYKFRCKIAHNNTFTREDFAQTITLIGEVSPKITEAIANLDSIEVPEDERDELAEKVAIKTSTMYGEYIQRWKEIEGILFSLYLTAFPSDDESLHKKLLHSPRTLAREIANIGWIGKRTLKGLDEINYIRNTIVHEPVHHFSAEQLAEHMKFVDYLINHLSTVLYEHSNKGKDGGEREEVRVPS